MSGTSIDGERGIARPERDWLIVIGGSAGSIGPLGMVLSQLPQGLPAAVVAVVHTHPRSGSMLPQILSRQSPWPVVAATDDEPIIVGRVYTAVPDHQLVVDGTGRLRVVRGPKESGHRPGIDPLFRSAAASPFKTIGVVLSGGLDDGSAGAAMILRNDGYVVVQDPATAEVPDMPRHAAATGVDAVLPADAIMEWIAATVLDGSPEHRPVEPLGPGPELGDLAVAERTDFICPDCGGAMRRVEDLDVLRFRCHVGHGWTAEALRARQDEDLDAALWTALRTVEDQVTLDERLLARAERSGRPRGALAIQKRLGLRRAASQALWDMLTSGPAHPAAVDASPVHPPATATASDETADADQATAAQDAMAGDPSPDDDEEIRAG